MRQTKWMKATGTDTQNRAVWRNPPAIPFNSCGYSVRISRTSLLSGRCMPGTRKELLNGNDFSSNHSIKNKKSDQRKSAECWVLSAEEKSVGGWKWGVSATCWLPTDNWVGNPVYLTGIFLSVSTRKSQNFRTDGMLTFSSGEWGKRMVGPKEIIFNSG